MGESSAGPETLSKDELADNHCDTLANARVREMDDEWYRGRSPDWSKVVTPFLSAANWAGFGLHPRGNFEAFANAATKEKWLEGHPGRHEEWFYLEYGMQLQKRFFDFYLKAVPNEWDKEPRVRLNLRRPFSDAFELRKENEWPLAGTRWTKLFLNAGPGSLNWSAPDQSGSMTFDAKGEGVTWMSPPLEQETEITGGMAGQAVRLVYDVRRRLVRNGPGLRSRRTRGRIFWHRRPSHALGARMVALLAP